MVVCACVCVCYRGRASSERVGLRDEDVEREREFFFEDSRERKSREIAGVFSDLFREEEAEDCLYSFTLKCRSSAFRDDIERDEVRSSRVDG